MLPKDKKLTAMLDADEIRMLEELAALTGVNMSQIVRTMIREKHAEKVGKKKSRASA